MPTSIKKYRRVPALTARGSHQAAWKVFWLQKSIQRGWDTPPWTAEPIGRICTHTPLSCPPRDCARAPKLLPIRTPGLVGMLHAQQGRNSLQSRTLAVTQRPSTGGSEAGLSLSVAALPLSNPKIKPKEISENQWYLTQPTQGKHPLWRHLGFLRSAHRNFSYGKCV